MTSALPVPKYHQIYLVLREQLHEGRFAGGLPGEIALMREFGVARVTVRKALERLAAERLISRRPGRGTVALPILALLEESGVQVGRATQVTSARLADAEVARHLDVAIGSALLSVQRLVFDRRERPVQWLLGLYRPDRYEYRSELSRVGRIDAKILGQQVALGGASMRPAGVRGNR